jgi:DNA repair protein RadD
MRVKEKPKFVPRDYQEKSIQEGLRFFQSNSGQNEIQVLPTGSGKSVCIAGIADRFEEPILILQPSQEILKQNYAKYVSYGGHAGIYSASVGRKDLGHVTFASIQSIMSRDKQGKYPHAEKFKHFRHVIIDECHFSINPKGGQILDFLAMLKNPRVLGFTATPFRMYPHFETSMLKMITRTRPKIFGKLAYYVQIGDLKVRGFLCPTKYYSLTKDFDRKQLKVNSTGADFDEGYLRKYYDSINFKEDVMEVILRVNAKGRRVLAFVNFVADAQYISESLEDSATVHALTPKAERERIEKEFKEGKIMSVVNCGTWTTGFDDEYLDCVLLARPLRSLSMYYQMFGRGLRFPADMPKKESWLIDLCGNMNVFGRVEELRVEMDKIGLPCITGTGGRLLTGVPLSEQDFPTDKFGQKL